MLFIDSRDYGEQISRVLPTEEAVDGANFHPACICSTMLSRPEAADADGVIGSDWAIRFFEGDRRLVHRSNSRQTVKYPCLTMCQMLQCLPNELPAHRLLDADPHIDAMNGCVCEVTFTLDGVVHLHRPDFYLVVRGRKELWDVVAPEEDRTTQPSASLLRRGLAKLGYAYRELLSSKVLAQPRLRNSEILVQFARYTPSACEREAIRRSLTQSGHITWGEALQGEFGPRGRETICRLAFEGVLLFDLCLPLTTTTKFRFARGNDTSTTEKETFVLPIY